MKIVFLILSTFICLSCASKKTKFINKNNYIKHSSCTPNSKAKVKNNIYRDISSTKIKRPTRGYSDPHMHYWPPNDFSILEKYIEKLNVIGGLILASAYTAESEADFKKNGYPIEEWIPLSSRKNIYLTVSNYIKESKDKKFLGLCGVNTYWSDLKEQVDYCLKLPHMAGIKIHHPVQSRETPELVNIYPKLNQLISNYEKPQIVLLHPDFDFESIYDQKMNSNDGEYQYNESDYNTETNKAKLTNNRIMNSILKMISDNPQHTFIIAHMGDGFIPLKVILRNIEKTSKQTPDNLFFDLSAAFNIQFQSEEAIARQLDIWRKIGLDHIMFSSDPGNLKDLEGWSDDRPIPQGTYYYSFLNAAPSLLTNEEKNLMLYEVYDLFMKHHLSK